MKKNDIINILLNPIFAAFFLSLTLICVALYPYIYYDEGLWSYIGRIWVNNNLPPYSESVENKTPGIFFLFSITEYLFGGSFFITRLIGALSVLISSLLLYKICKKTYNEFVGIIAFYIFGLASCWFILDGCSLAQTETFMVLFSIVSFYKLITIRGNVKASLFVSGICLGIAISFKQIAITTFLAFFIVYLINRPIKKNLPMYILNFIWYGVGALSGLFLTYLILFLFSGVPLNDYIDGAWLILLNSGSKAPDFSVRVDEFLKVFLNFRFLIFYPIALLVLFKFKKLKSKFFIGIVIWFLIDFLGVNASGYYFGHQIKQILPQLSILSALALSSMLIELNAMNNKFIIKNSSFIMVLIILFFPYKQVLLTGYEYTFDRDIVYKDLASWLNKNTAKNDYIYILGADSYLVKSLYYSNRVSSSKYFHSIFITGQKENALVYKDLMDKPPIFIIKDKEFLIKESNYSPEIIDLINNNYSEYKQGNNYQIFKRMENGNF